MSRSALTSTLLASLGLALCGLPASPADAYTLVDWMRSWPNYYSLGTVAPAPAVPAAMAAPTGPVPYYPPAAALPTPPAGTTPLAAVPPAIYVPPSAVPPPVTQPSVIQAPPTYAPPPPTYAPPPPTYSAPAPTYTAPAPACGTPMPTCGTPMPTCGTPTPTCGTPMTTVIVNPPSASRGCCSNLCDHLHRMFGCQTPYRAARVQVPTTYYRPSTTYYPSTGQTITSMQPCGTYTWQETRVPVRSLGGCTTCEPPVGYGSQVVSSGTMATPYYSAPAAPSATFSAPYSAPPNVNPSVTSPGIPLTPGASAPPTYGSGGGSEPANQAPRLSPGEVQPLQPIPSTSFFPPQPPPDVPGSSKAVSPPVRSSGPQLDITPVPDPEAEKSTPRRIPATPSLYDPQDRTAARVLSSSWPVTPIQWPAPVHTASAARAETSASHPAATSPPPSPVPASSGWRAVRP